MSVFLFTQNIISIIHHLLFKSFKDIGKNVIHATFCGNLQRIKIRQWNLVVYQSTPRENMILTAAHLLAKWAICKRENSWNISTKLRVVSFWCKVFFCFVTEEILYSITAVSDRGSYAKPLYLNEMILVMISFNM